jgi:2-keto-4-pentenoate hydratase
MVMDPGALAEAARVLIEARRKGRLAERFPLASRPTDADEADAIQQAVTAGLGERVAGWKVAPSDQYGLLRGALIPSRLFPDAASISASMMPAIGVEAEIAFRCDRDLPPRDEAYEREEVEERVTALVGIEIVNSRFRDSAAIPVIERAADCMSNGGFVIGPARADWRGFDLSALPASLIVNGERIVDRRVGGHVARDPILPLIVLANILRKTTGLFKGQVVTTGTYTGVTPCKIGDQVEGVFEDFGKVSLRVSA